YRSYPRLVGETGGKDFVVAHPSADRAILKTALPACAPPGSPAAASPRLASAWGNCRHPRRILGPAGLQMLSP
ncbi:1-pyrroline-5-carboxylate dehydrogenase, partial [Streptomyces sp. NPDC127040]